jgi:hypothetical protein
MLQRLSVAEVEYGKDGVLQRLIVSVADDEML